MTYSQRSSNRQLLEKIYLKLRHRVTPEEAAPTAILRCLQDGLERSIDAGIRLEAEQWSVVRRSRSTLNRVNTLHVTRQKALQRKVNQDSPYPTARGAWSRIDGNRDRLHSRSGRVRSSCCRRIAGGFRAFSSTHEEDGATGRQFRFVEAGDTCRLIKSRPLGPRDCRPRALRLYCRSHFRARET